MKNRNRTVFGLQWGDEGKGKIVDKESADVAVVVRAEGGANAGHTISVGDLTFVGHLLPSGAVAGKLCALGRGVRFDQDQFYQEIIDFEQTFDRRPDVMVDRGAYLNFQWHRALEVWFERAKGDRCAYTTFRGMCTSGATIDLRLNPQVAMLFRPDLLRQVLRDFYASFEPIFRDSYFRTKEFIDRYGELLGPDEMVEALLESAQRIKPYVGDVRVMLLDTMARDEAILFEGAQGNRLDCYWGTYLFNTQGICTAAGLAVGTGLPVDCLGDKVGVAKVTHSRVGNGPQPTEFGDDRITNHEEKIPEAQREAWLVEMLEKINAGMASDQEIGQYFRVIGGEYGATSGRPRRMGWLDLFDLKYAVAINAPDSLALTKLDCLSRVKKLRVAIDYILDGTLLSRGCPPVLSADLAQVEVRYVDLPGWDADITGETDWDALPREAQDYVKFVESTVGVPVRYIGTGPERDAVIVRPTA